MTKLDLPAGWKIAPPCKKSRFFKVGDTFTMMYPQKRKHLTKISSGLKPFYDHLRCSWDNLKKSVLLHCEIHLLQHSLVKCCRRWNSWCNKTDFSKLFQEHRKWSQNVFSPELTLVRCFFFCGSMMVNVSPTLKNWLFLHRGAIFHPAGKSSLVIFRPTNEI